MNRDLDLNFVFNLLLSWNLKSKSYENKQRIFSSYDCLTWTMLGICY